MVRDLWIRGAGVWPYGIIGRCMGRTYDDDKRETEKLPIGQNIKSSGPGEAEAGQPSHGTTTSALRKKKDRENSSCRKAGDRESLRAEVTNTRQRVGCKREESACSACVGTMCTVMSCTRSWWLRERRYRHCMYAVRRAPLMLAMWLTSS